MAKELKEGEEVQIGEHTYRVVDQQLVKVSKDTQLDRIEKKLDELEKKVDEQEPITVPMPYPVPQPVYPWYRENSPWHPYYPFWTSYPTLTIGETQEVTGNDLYTTYSLGDSGEMIPHTQF